MAARVFAAGIVGAALLTCATAAIASAAARPGAIRALTLSAPEQKQLLRLCAAHRHIPVSDIDLARSGQVHAARTSEGTEWLLERFSPSPSAPLSVSISFQVTADSGVFTHLPGGRGE